MPATTQQNIYSIHPTIKTSQNKNTIFSQTFIQSTIKPSVVPKYSQMDYQTFRPITKITANEQPKNTQKNTISDHNYNLFAYKKIAKTPYKSNQSQSQAQNYNQQIQQQVPHSAFFNNQQRDTLNHSKNIPFLNITINNKIQSIIAKTSRFSK